MRSLILLCTGATALDVKILCCVLPGGFSLWLLFSQPWDEASKVDWRFSRGNCYYYSAVFCGRMAVPQESSSNNSLQ